MYVVSVLLRVFLPGSAKRRVRDDKKRFLAGINLPLGLVAYLSVKQQNNGKDNIRLGSSFPYRTGCHDLSTEYRTHL